MSNEMFLIFVAISILFVFLNIFISGDCTSQTMTVSSIQRRLLKQGWGIDLARSHFQKAEFSGGQYLQMDVEVSLVSS